MAGQVHGEPPFAFCACIGTMNRGIGAPASCRRVAASGWGGTGRRDASAPRPVSWKAPSALRPCIGTMNLIILLLVLVLETKPLDRGRERQRGRGRKGGSWEDRFT